MNPASLAHLPLQLAWRPQCPRAARFWSLEYLWEQSYPPRRFPLDRNIPPSGSYRAKSALRWKILSHAPVRRCATVYHLSRSRSHHGWRRLASTALINSQSFPASRSRGRS